MVNAKHWRNEKGKNNNMHIHARAEFNVVSVGQSERACVRARLLLLE